MRSGRPAFHLSFQIFTSQFGAINSFHSRATLVNKKRKKERKDIFRKLWRKCENFLWLIRIARKWKSPRACNSIPWKEERGLNLLQMNTYILFWKKVYKTKKYTSVSNFMCIWLICIYIRHTERGFFPLSIRWWRLLFLVFLIEPRRRLRLRCGASQRIQHTHSSSVSTYHTGYG